MRYWIFEKENEITVFDSVNEKIIDLTEIRSNKGIVFIPNPQNILIRHLTIYHNYKKKNYDKYIWAELSPTLPKERQEYTFILDKSKMRNKELTVYFFNKNKLIQLSELVAGNGVFPNLILPWEMVINNITNKEEKNIIVIQISNTKYYLLTYHNAKFQYRQIIDINSKSINELIHQTKILLNIFTEGNKSINTIFIGNNKPDFLSDLELENIAIEDTTNLIKKVDITKIKSSVNTENLYNHLYTLELYNNGRNIVLNRLLYISFIILLIISSINISLFIHNERSKKYLKKNEQLAKNSKKLYKHIQKAQKDMKIMINFANEQIMVDILKDISIRLPFTVKLNNISIIKNKRIQFTGESESYDDISLTISLLNEVPYLKQIKLVSSAKKDNIFEFTILCKFKG